MSMNLYLRPIERTTGEVPPTTRFRAPPMGEKWLESPRVHFLIAGSHTHERAELIEAVLTKEDHPDPHIHADKDETFYIISGMVNFIIEEETITAPSGSTIHIERGKRHSFSPATPAASVLVLLTNFS